jgi:hypothetical protein
VSIPLIHRVGTSHSLFRVLTLQHLKTFSDNFLHSNRFSYRILIPNLWGSKNLNYKTTILFIELMNIGQWVSIWVTRTFQRVKIQLLILPPVFVNIKVNDIYVAPLINNVPSFKVVQKTLDFMIVINLNLIQKSINFNIKNLFLILFVHVSIF